MIFERMTRLEVDAADGVVAAELGVRLSELNHELARYGFFLVDPGSVRSVAVGGAVANSAGEMRGAKYGAMRDWVLGLRVVTDKGTWLGCRTF